MTYYDILQLKQDATLTDVRKAYRRLAMQHHPDRNRGNEEEATLIFQKVSEAYEVISDETKRKEYDEALRSGSVGDNTWKQRQQRRPHRDAFSQFNDLFRNDPFFNEAFQDMDERFATEFQRNSRGGSSTTVKQTTTAATPKKTWGEWLIDKMGVNIQISTSTTVNGQQSSSTYQRSTSSYTKKSSRTVYENGQRFTIMSLEKDGNKIEEKYIGENLVGRLINGVPEQDARRLDL